MKLVHNGNVYSYILTEDEWYSGTDQQREAWVNEIQRKGGEAKARFLSVMVKPDDVMSISPVAKQHRVWYQTLSTTVEEQFRADAEELLRDGLHSGLTIARMRAIVNEVFK